MDSTPPPSPMEVDTYAYQREELLSLLRRLSKTNEPLLIHGVPCLTSDDAARLLHKTRQGTSFSDRERRVLTEAGFDLHNIFPKL
ncbi:MAG: hypothetical protein JNK54_04470 [Elusimicrobia bacterium]|jgi:hypothetical protein|nr:hypothetical protein [Elusimicrobiota bacterium]